MTTNSISSAGMSAYRGSSAITLVSSFGAQDSPVWPVANLSASGGARAETGDTVTLLKGGESTDSATAGKGAESNGIIRRETPRNADGVVFVYTFKGDLRIKFVDSFNNLVYQTPPELFTRISDIMNNSQTALDMTV